MHVPLSVVTVCQPLADAAPATSVADSEFFSRSSLSTDGRMAVLPSMTTPSALTGTRTIAVDRSGLSASACTSAGVPHTGGFGWHT